MARRTWHPVGNARRLPPADLPRPRPAEPAACSLSAPEPPGTLAALVVTESAIDALSLAQFDGCPATRAFPSTAGAPSRRRREQIALAASVLPNVGTVALAHDGDEAGDRRAENPREWLKVAPRVSVHRRRPPESAGWNDVAIAAAKG